MPTQRIEVPEYLRLRRKLVDLGFSDEIEWAQSVKPISDPLVFWREYAWVVLNSGLANRVAHGIWARVRPVVEAGGSAASVFGHKGKAAGIDQVYANRETLLLQYLNAHDKLEFIQALPWIGPITRYHLAKNYGLDCSKPDRHLVRIAGDEGVQEMCQRLSVASGDRVGTVDLVLWRACEIGLIDSRAVSSAG